MDLVGIGVFIALLLRFRYSGSAFCNHLYLPVHLSVPMMIGGCARWVLEKKKRVKNRTCGYNGVSQFRTYHGEGLVGILLAVFAIIKLPVVKTFEMFWEDFYWDSFCITGCKCWKYRGYYRFALLTFSLWKPCS